MKDGKYLIGIIDDDESFRDSTSYFLERNGYEVKLFDSGVDFLEQFKANPELQHELDLITLDILMPGLNGNAVLDAIRKNEHFSKLKVIIMSSENTVDNRIDLIEAGADDFTAKSDSIYELLARIKARLRDIPTDTSDQVASQKEEPQNTPLEDRGTTIYAEGKPVDLTASEYRIVSTLLRNLDNYVSKSELQLIVFGDFSDARARSLDFHTTRIRAKLSALKLPYTPVITAKKGYGIKLSSSQGSDTKSDKKSGKTK